MKFRPDRVVVCVLVAAVVAPVAIWGFNQAARAREENRRIRCRNNLNQIAKALDTYLNEHGGHRYYPPHLGVLVDSRVLPDPSVLACPYDPDPPKLPNGLPCSYMYNPIDLPLGDDFPPNEPIAWERKIFYGELRWFVYADSHLEGTTMTDEELATFVSRMKPSKGASSKADPHP